MDQDRCLFNVWDISLNDLGLRIRTSCETKMLCAKAANVHCLRYRDELIVGKFADVSGGPGTNNHELCCPGSKVELYGL